MIRPQAVHRPAQSPGGVLGRRVVEPVGELLDDAGGQRVGKGQQLGHDVVEGRDVLRPVLGQPGDNLASGQLQVLGEKVVHVTLVPVRIGVAQEICDVDRVAVPPGVLLGEKLIVAGEGCGNQVYGDEDVLLEQVGHRSAGFIAVERDDRVADVLLVAKEAAGSGAGVGATGNSRYDVLPGPDGVVGPKAVQGLLQRLVRAQGRGLHGFSRAHRTISYYGAWAFSGLTWGWASSARRGC